MLSKCSLCQQHCFVLMKIESKYKHFCSRKFVKMPAKCQPFCLAFNVPNPFQNYNLPSWLLYYIEYLLWPHSCDAIGIMMTSSNGNIFSFTGPLCGEFTGDIEFPSQRPVTRSFDVSFDLRLNKRLSKQS